ncbi:MAG: DUF3047 domain-containing protein [Nitrospiraceae bacterium]|nr:DUF3047 domain-containing protein [Nitrospiraceae bacterium]
MLRFQNAAAPTDYSIGLDGEGMALKAVSHASASGIYTEVDLDANEYPVITWEWKVANLIAKGDATTKNGHDFPARIIGAFHYDPAQASVFNRYLKVESDRSSSAKGVYLTFAPRQCPYVSWRWRISDTIAAGDLTRKEGDNAAAKLYVVFHASSFRNPLDKRILVYPWDHRVPVGTIYPNAWLRDKERMVILKSGTAKAGRWVNEQVHLANDFTRVFPGEEPGEVEAVAFLADTDNTRSRVTVGFDDLTICCIEPETSRVRR